MLLKPKEAEFVNFLKKNLPKKRTRQIIESAAMSFCHPNPLIRWFFWQRIRLALEITRGLSFSRVLDFGSGSGVLLPFCAPRAGIVYALDKNHFFTQKVIDEFRLRNVRAISYLNGEIPLKPESIDLVYALEVFEHIGDLDDTILKILRLCKSGGYLLFSIPTENFFYKLGRALAGFKGDSHSRFSLEIVNKVERRFIFKKQSVLFEFLPMYLFGLYRKGKKN